MSPLCACGARGSPSTRCGPPCPRVDCHLRWDRQTESHRYSGPPGESGGPGGRCNATADRALPRLISLFRDDYLDTENPLQPSLAFLPQCTASPHFLDPQGLWVHLVPVSHVHQPQRAEGEATCGHDRHNHRVLVLQRQVQGLHIDATCLRQAGSHAGVHAGGYVVQAGLGVHACPQEFLQDGK